MNVLITVLSILAIYVLNKVIKKALRFWAHYQHLKNIPGPKSEWLLGHARIFMTNGKPDTRKGWQLLPKIAQEYDGVYKMRFGLEQFVHITKPEYIESLLSSSKLIEKGVDYDVVSQWLGNGLLTSRGNKWRHHRKLLTPAFHFKVLEQFIPVINEQSFKLGRKLEENPHESILPKITRCTLAVILETSMGLKMDVQEEPDNEYCAALEKYSELIMLKLLDPIMDIWPLFELSSSGREYFKVIEKLKKFTKTFVNQRKAELMQQGFAENTKRKPFLDMILDMHFKDPGSITEEEIREQVDTFTFGGHDTTATSLTFILWNIGRFPEIQERIHDELDEIFGEDQDRHVEQEDIKKMVYIEAVIKESMRLFPPVCMVLRELSDDCNLDEKISLTKGIQVGVPILSTHRDPKLWPDPEKFDPERFHDEGQRSRHAFAYIPFSGGPRNCIGQKFALLEEKIIVANVLRKYQLRSLDTQEDLDLAMELLLKPKNPVRVKLIPRIR